MGLSGVLRVAVASGKGGTGKTTVATNLAALLAGAGRSVTYLDADVEAPNGHLFLAPRITSEENVEIPVPVLDAERCTRCGRCAEVCQYGALVFLGRRVLSFPALCHGCGGCALACPAGAITEVGRRIGSVIVGQSGAGDAGTPIRFIQGRLDIGQPLAPPVIRAAKARLPADGVQLVDAPPGTACGAMHAVGGGPTTCSWWPSPHPSDSTTCA